MDTGLMNYFLGVQAELLGTDDLNKVYQGTIIEHLAGQELLSGRFNILSSLSFWVREKSTSVAEVDYIYSFDGKLIPVEVKSGKEGTLRSLHLFMQEAPHGLAIRVYGGVLSLQEVILESGKAYRLLNLPYYLLSMIDDYLQWFKER